MRAMKFGVGQAVRRVEDARFVTGTGRYTSDIYAEGMAHAVVVRSPHAHARFTIENADEVRAMPGVLAVYTAEDVAHLGDIPCLGAVKNSDGKRMVLPPNPVLPKDTVRHVGEAVAFIVAETEAAAGLPPGSVPFRELRPNARRDGNRESNSTEPFRYDPPPRWWVRWWVWGSSRRGRCRRLGPAITRTEMACTCRLRHPVPDRGSCATR